MLFGIILSYYRWKRNNIINKTTVADAVLVNDNNNNWNNSLLAIIPLIIVLSYCYIELMELFQLIPKRTGAVITIVKLVISVLRTQI